MFNRGSLVLESAGPRTEMAASSQLVLGLRWHHCVSWSQDPGGSITNLIYFITYLFNRGPLVLESAGPRTEMAALSQLVLGLTWHHCFSWS